MSPIRALPFLAAGAIVGAGGLLAWPLLRPEASLRLAFETALAARQEGPGDVALSDASPLDQRHLWLSRSGDQPLGFAGPVRIGSRIDIKDAEGHGRVLEVVDVREIELGFPAGRPLTRLLMVTCRDAAAPAASVRFLMEAAGLEDAAHSMQGQRTL